MATSRIVRCVHAKSEGVNKRNWEKTGQFRVMKVSAKICDSWPRA